jgi:hypothetical protein
VNQLLPYEKVIADKFSHAAVPDMADDIWASIETELGPGSPTDNGVENEPPPSSPTGTGGVMGFKFLIVAFVTIAVLFIVRKKNASNSKQKDATIAPAINSSTNKDSLVANDSFSENPARPVGNKINMTPVKTVISDSGIRTVIPLNPPLPNNQQDSIAKLSPASTDPLTNPVILKPNEQSVVPVKKGKGVRDIKDTDYKIVTKKKDSL